MLSLWHDCFFILMCYNEKFIVEIGLVVMELCCHNINMNAKEKHIIRDILKIGALFPLLTV